MYKLSDLIENINYKASISLDGVCVNGICADSRAVLPGNVFFCIKGGKSDGADYIKEAIRRGARVVICENGCETYGAPTVTVENTRSAYAIALSSLHGRPAKKLKIIAITGTNGKTTVSKMIQNALQESGKRCAIIGTLGASFEGKSTSLSTMTTPDPEVLYALLAQYVSEGAEYVVMEASSHALALGKLDGIDFEIGAITNLTAEHLDFHGNMESYYAAKSSLFDKCKKGVFLCDDYYTVKMHAEAKCKRVSCSVTNKSCEFHAENIAYSFENGTQFTVMGKKPLTLHCEIPAEFTVSNALLACTVLRELGIPDADIYKGIASLGGVEGRMERIETGRDFSIFIDFAHTPDALARLLTSVRKIKGEGERIITLFGCGGDRDKSKRSLMGAVASRLSDFVVITADNSRSENTESIIDEIMTGFDKTCPHIRIDDRKSAIEYAVMNAGRGDIILLCGKGHEKYEIDKRGIRPFSERAVVKKALADRKKTEGK